MTLVRARIVKGIFADVAEKERPQRELARRVPREVLYAREEAERILEDARANAARLAEDAASAAAVEARERETARLAAAFLTLRAENERRAERDLDRATELAVLLAERLVGEALRVDPARIGELAAAALEEARGARRVQIDAHPDDVTALEAMLAEVGHVARVEAAPSLRRGSLVVHTDLGHVDARLEPQLARLGAALREALA